MEAKTRMYENVLKASFDEYNNKMRAFDRLDVKAQQIAAFSGAILSLLISFCKKETLELLRTVNQWCILLSITSLIFLLIAICLSIFSMRIIKFYGMPTFNDLRLDYNNLCLIDNDQFQDEHYQIFISNQIRNWNKSFQSISSVNRNKANYVFISQVLCGFGLFILGFIGIIILQSYLFF